MLSLELTKDGWFDALPASQTSLIKHMLEAGKSEEEIATLWLERTGPEATAGFGAVGGTKLFFVNVKQEFDAFLCDDTRYKDERQEAIRIWEKEGKVALVSMVSAVIASQVNLALAAIVPVVALLFSLCAK